MDEYKKERAVLVGVHRGLLETLADSDEHTLEELGELADTAGAEVVFSVLQNRPQPDPALYIGEGKAEEIKVLIEPNEIDVVIFDDELSGIQLRNLENALGVKVIDRSMLILDIFAGRATTHEGKIQVELAQLNYLLPRLTGLGASLSRLGAGIGTRGPGESKLEMDRRHIRRRIATLREKLEESRKHRELLATGRKRRGVTSAAIIGYTNAGKSTLLNTLTRANVLAEDKLFATLDPTARKLTLPDGQEVLLVDTVGFVNKLPHHLIEAFKSTLEELSRADILIHLIDIASPYAEEQMKVVMGLVEELGGGQKPMITVYNKVDLVPSELQSCHILGAPHPVEISAKTGEGIDELLTAISEELSKLSVPLTLLLPYREGALLGKLHGEAVILEETYEPEGTKVRALIQKQDLAKYSQFVV